MKNVFSKSVVCLIDSVLISFLCVRRFSSLEACRYWTWLNLKIERSFLKGFEIV